jgi:Protein of unknown function (DUF3667)
VSHLKQRKEKSCLNCNAAINGRYCSVCGQENLEPQESVWHLFTHFFNDITHFDGKFFSSVKYILTKPGFLTSEYVAGRRMSYLNPVRFYVFTSFLFFLILFSFLVKEDNLKLKQKDLTTISSKDSIKLEEKIKEFGIDTIQVNGSSEKTTLKSYIESAKKNSKKDTISFGTFNYRDKKQFDSLDKLGLVKEGYFKRIIINRGFQLKEKYGADKVKVLNALVDNILHLIPQVLFLSLPFFALILKLLYIRRKKYYYVAHIIFTIHFYIFVYIQTLLINFVGKIAELTRLNWLDNIAILLGVGILYYMYKAMRNFYQQSRWKTLIKLSILLFFLIFLFSFFTILLFGFSLYKL